MYNFLIFHLTIEEKRKKVVIFFLMLLEEKNIQATGQNSFDLASTKISELLKNGRSIEGLVPEL
jgi:nicotinic acid mononucleotide adenylyltransferase